MSKKIFQLFMLLVLITVSGVFSYVDAANAFFDGRKQDQEQNASGQQSDQKGD